MEIKVLMHEENGGFWAEVPSMPGCVSEGDTMSETLENIKEAIKGWLKADVPVSNRIKDYEVMTVAI